MENLLYNISQILGITIIHSLWQGLLVYLLVRLIIIGFPSASSDKKYNLLYIALLSLTVWFGYTFFTEAKNYNWTVNTISQSTSNLSDDINPYIASQQVNQLSDQSFLSNYKNIIQTYLPYISGLYAVCILINLARLAIGWQTIRKIKKGATAAGILQQRVNDLCTQLGIDKKIKLNFSQLVDVPCAIGYIKPILLLPITITTQLSADEIEVILIHELAHIKNNDYLLNLFQQIVMLLLFLNPFAQMISSMISRERENRCDDAVLLIGDPLTYARALVKLEKTRQKNLQLALAATGTKYHLFARIQRIMNTQKPVVNIKHLVFGLFIFISSLSSLAWLNPEIKNGRIASKRGEQAVSKLVGIVQKVITPEKAKTNSIQTNLVDTYALKPNDNSVIVAPDTLDYKAITAEMLRLRLILELDRQRLEPLFQTEEIKKARASLDSAEKILPTGNKSRYYRDSLSKITRVASEKWKNSPERKRKQAEVDRLSTKIFNILISDPEHIQRQKELSRIKDSIRNVIAPGNTGSESQFYDNPQWKAAFAKISVEGDILQQKIYKRPEVAPIYDSLSRARKAIYEGHEYEEYLKAGTMDSNPDLVKALRNAMERPDLAKYRATLKVLTNKVNESPEYKKYMEGIKKYNQMVKDLKKKGFYRD